ncbi:hypothetical protein [Eleftheria terrae]|uniref:hypothetical protein n=1 Tax=Eleftheria terrae TaxID=1597781 RepID=UPI00263B2745|nr:hypothetical protein [Eleftheria terrae]WKB55598.1 hypothetical protein N7L95_26350 [Eleftheria terrae]
MEASITPSAAQAAAPFRCNDEAFCLCPLNANDCPSRGPAFRGGAITGALEQALMREGIVW